MTFVHMHDGETVYYEDVCEICEAIEMRKEHDAQCGCDNP